MVWFEFSQALTIQRIVCWITVSIVHILRISEHLKKNILVVIIFIPRNSFGSKTLQLTQTVYFTLDTNEWNLIYIAI